MIRLIVALGLFLLSACYASHFPDDAGPSPDVAPVLDARTDAIGLEETCPGGLQLVDEIQVEWPSIDCGSATYPKVVATDGPGLFHALVTEERLCRDRLPHIVSQQVRIEGDRLVLDGEEILGDAAGPAFPAANGQEFAVCTGETLYRRDVRGSISAGQMREPLMGRPGCLENVKCVGLAHDGLGWAALWDRFECDIVVAELTRSDPLGGLRDGPVILEGRTGAIAGTPSGVVSASENRVGVRSLYTWDRDAPEPTAVDLARLATERGGHSAVADWPFVTGATAVVYVDEQAVNVRVVTRDGTTIRDQTFEASLMGYAPSSLSAAVTPFGLAIAAGYGWTGGRADSAYRHFAVGQTALLLDEVQTGVGLASAEPVHVAVSGRYVLFHQSAVLTGSDAVRTSLTLYACD